MTEMDSLFPLDDYQSEDTLTLHLGAADSALLVDAFGGLNLTIPKTTTSEAYALIVKELGEALTTKLMEHFGGEYLYIPKRDAEKIARRNANIKALYFKLLAEGLTVSRAQAQCAQAHSLSARHIHRILFP